MTIRLWDVSAAEPKERAVLPNSRGPFAFAPDGKTLACYRRPEKEDHYVLLWDLSGVEPKERGGGFEFSDAIVGGAIPRQFIPAVEKGIVDTIATGGALGFPVVDVKVTCYDGKYHPVDSSEMSFKMAGSLGFKEAAAKARPVLLEPISELVITVPEAYQGDVMGDLNSKRGRIQGTASVGNGEQEITALVPTSEVIRYAIDLRSLTGGRGRFTATHSHYDPAPPNLAEKIVAEAAAAREG